MSLSLSQLPELSNQEIWQEQWGQVKKLRDNLWGEAQTLIKK